MSGRTRGHYDYTLSPLELDFRKTVARALIARGDPSNANFYIRFWAYAVSRCPVVLEDARLGRNPSFYVPFGSLKEALRASCPEIIGDMELILGGRVTREEVVKSVSGTYRFRQLVTSHIGEKGLFVRASAKDTRSGNEAIAP